MSSYAQMPAAEVQKRAVASLESVFIARQRKADEVIVQVLAAQESWWRKLWKLPGPTRKDVEFALQEGETGMLRGEDTGCSVYVSWDDHTHYYLAQHEYSKQYGVASRLNQLAMAAGSEATMWISDEDWEMIA